MKATTNLKSKSVRIQKDQYRALRKISQSTGWSISWLIKTAIKQYLDVVGKNITNEGAQHE